MTLERSTTTGTVVIGAGQAGLATGYHLARRGQDFVVLEAADAVGTSWRQRWDSLRVFTPARFTHLPGMVFPADPQDCPGKDAVADYLRAYAETFGLPVELRTRVESVQQDGKAFEVTAGRRRWRASSVVLASGAHTARVTPNLARDLHPRRVTQLHAAEYRRPDQVPEGPVLVVGAGNSGAEIALDLATDTTAERQVFLAGRDVGHIPQLGPWTYPMMQRLGRPGAALSERALHGRGDPLGRVRPGQLEAAGVQRLPPVTGARDGLPLLADGRVVTAAAVVWCTGLRPDYSWLRLDAIDHDGRLQHRGGVVASQPGLYAVGLPYQRSITSHLLGGVGDDAKHITKHIASRHFNS